MHELNNYMPNIQKTITSCHDNLYTGVERELSLFPSDYFPSLNT